MQKAEYQARQPNPGREWSFTLVFGAPPIPGAGTHMDRYLQKYIEINVHVDSGQRVFCDGKELQVHVIGGERKVALPISKQTFTFDDLKRAGAKVDVVTLKSLAVQGAQARWHDEIEARRENGLPSNVYIANARSIAYAIEKGRTPPAVTYIGRKRDKMTETYDTVQEVIDAMAADKWKTTFTRGGRAKRKTA